MAHVHRSGGVDADIFHHHLLPLAQVHVSVFVPHPAHFFYLPSDPSVTEMEVNKAGRRGLHPVDLVASRDIFDQRFGKLQGIDAGSPGQPERQAGGEIAVLGLCWSLYLNLRRSFQLQQAFSLGLLYGLGNQLSDDVQDRWGCHVEKPILSSESDAEMTDKSLKGDQNSREHAYFPNFHPITSSRGDSLDSAYEISGSAGLVQ